MKTNKIARPEKWKSSGSKRRMISKQRYSDTRGRKELELDGVPARRSMVTRRNFWSGGVNINYLYRLLQKNVGKRWNDVRSELLKKIPKGIKDYGDVIGRLVAEETEIVGKKIWDKKQNEFLGFNNFKPFYVHPTSGILKWVVRSRVSYNESFNDR